MNTADVVVGVDGSAQSRHALRWAAAEAARRGSRLRIVHAYRPPLLIREIAAGTGLDAAALAQAQRVVADCVEEARTAAPQTIVTGTTACCHAVPLLLENAGPAALLVVGSHGHGGVAGLALGSTGLDVVTRASGPVVVVRGSVVGRGASVVVGTDGSAHADVAVGTAFDAAAACGCALLAVHSFHGAAAPAIGDERPFVDADAALRGWLAPWRDKYPDVPVETVTTQGAAASVLVALSSAARLVVVGTRGRGGFAGLLLGSVGHRLIQHAHCPVLVAR